MRYDKAKFIELLLYVAKRLEDDPAGGALKLNKVLYFAEFGHVRVTGSPISGAAFQKLPYGPAPRCLVPVRQELVDSGVVRLEQTAHLGRTQVRLVPERPANTSVFSKAEIESIEQALEALRPYNGSEASDLSHEEVGWQIVDEGETIPFETAYLRQPIVTDAIRRHTEALAADLRLI